MAKVNGNGLLFRIGRFVYRSLFSTIWRAEVIGSENVPKTGGVIIAPNHLSLADPPLTGSYLKRPLFFMAKKELFKIPVFGKLISMVNAFPVARNKQDVGAFRTAIKLLKSGNALLIFPEGTRSRNGQIGNARSGIAMIAVAANVPVVPVRIINSNNILRFGKVKIVYGNAMLPPVFGQKGEYKKFAEQIIEEIKKL